MKQKQPKPTGPQRRALEDIDQCGNPYARVFGMSMHGGMFKVICALKRNAWVTEDLETGAWYLTDLGVKALRDT